MNEENRVARMFDWRLRPQLDLDRNDLEMEGKKFSAGWDESFKVHVPTLGDLGIGPEGQISDRYSTASNEFWAGHSASIEKRIELEHFLHNSHIKPGKVQSVLDYMKTHVFRQSDESVSAHVGGVMDDEIREKTDWLQKDFPDLLDDRSVKKIHLIDDVTGHTTTLNREAVMRLFNEKFEQGEETFEQQLNVYQQGLLPKLDALEESLKAAAGTPAEPWIERKLEHVREETMLGVRDFALRKFAQDLDGARRLIQKQDLEGDIPKPTDTDDLRKWNLTLELQDHGTMVTTLQAPRQGLSFHELQDRALLQREVQEMQRSLSRDFELIMDKGDRLTDKTDPEVRDARKQLASGLRSLRKEVEAFVDLVSVCEQMQMNLDLERRSVLGEVINTDTKLGKHLQEEAYMACQLQSLTEELLKSEKAQSEGKATSGETQVLNQQIADLRRKQEEHGKTDVSLDDLSPKMKERVEALRKAKADSHEVKDSLRSHLKTWRHERGVLDVGQKEGIHSKLENSKGLTLRFTGLNEQHATRMAPFEKKDPGDLMGMPLLSSEQREKLAEKSQKMTGEIFEAALWNAIPFRAVGALVSGGFIVKERLARDQALERMNDPKLSAAHRLEAKWKAKLAKWHIIQNTASAAVGMVPLVGTPACLALSMANLVYDWVQGAKLEGLKETLRASEEKTAWRKPSARLPDRKEGMESEIPLGKDRGFTAFTKERWKILLDEVHQKDAKSPSEGHSVSISK